MDQVDEKLMKLIFVLFYRIRCGVAKNSGDTQEQKNEARPLPSGGTTMKLKTQVKKRYVLMERDKVLQIISEHEAISQKRLASYLAIRPQSLWEMLVKLENDGYIIRAKNKKDRRETLVSLTEKGRERAKEVEAIRSRQAEEFLKPLTKEEKDTLLVLLEKLALTEDLGLRSQE